MQFNLAEVVARVQAGLRRSLAGSGNVTRQMLLAAPFEFDLERHEVAVKVDGTRHAPVLTLTELKLLAQVARAPRRVFIRGELMAACLIPLHTSLLLKLARVCDAGSKIHHSLHA
ncbi:hypothetical protein WL05_24695 [Burkholderia ubonensis]|nr:hypothetical protein WJ51_15265 [Burkholderia ubonensis]KVM14978.1 hypothetical protein WJ52_16160 [Burkholderia ubonensis]KVM44366.1 hypothetical protein WJ56_27905 [Burkholderia ubonensis]KVX43042.1 hypothetical protein WL05_24695 [Burkholderia ubonensis]